MASVVDDDVASMLAMLSSRDEDSAVDLEGRFGQPSLRKCALAKAVISDGGVTLLHYVAAAPWMPPVFLSADIMRAERVLSGIERALSGAVQVEQTERRAALFAVWLLQHGANAAARTVRDNFTAMHVAAARGWMLMVAVLAAFVPDATDLVNASDVNGNTAMHMAASGGYGNLFMFMTEKWQGDWAARNAKGEAAALLLVRRLLAP